MEKVKCPICQTLIDDNPFAVFCPNCKWGYSGMEKYFTDDDIDDYNLKSRNQVKQLLKQGLNKYGEPISK